MGGGHIAALTMPASSPPPHWAANGEVKSNPLSETARISSLNLETVFLQLTQSDSTCTQLRGLLRVAASERSALLRLWRREIVVAEQEATMLARRLLLQDERAKAAADALSEVLSDARQDAAE